MSTTPPNHAPAFVHLHVHSEYAIHDSIVRLKPLLKKVAEHRQPAIAITDTHNLFGSIKFYRAAIAIGVKPIIGAEVKVLHSSGQISRWVFLCQNNQGYLNLCQILSKCHLNTPQPGEVMACESWLPEHHEGLIAIYAFNQGPLQQALAKNDTDAAHQMLNAWQATYPTRFYLEVQNLGKTDEQNYLQALATCALTTQTPMVATNDVRFLDEEDFEAHDVKVCIQNSDILNDPRRPKHYTEQQYLKSSEAMHERFTHMPGAIANTLAIAERCNFQFDLEHHFLPEFATPNGQEVDAYCTQLVEERLATYCAEKKLTDDQIRIYQERLAFEMNIITKMKFVGYFLIVADFIEWSKNHDIPVGPGRGSGAGSLVAFMLKITGLDPIEHTLLFERFLNPERVSMPDFDIDFCMEGRDRVIDYVAEKYGQPCVSQIITYGTMAAKAVIRDVGRVMGHPYGFVDTIAKLIPFELGMTLEKALEEEAQLKTRYDQEEPVKALIDMGMKLEGIVRNAGKHAGGVIIAPKPLNQFTALYCDNDQQSPVTHLDKDDVESIGLIKFDFLGLRTLTTIHWAVQEVNQQRAPDHEDYLDIDHIPIDDPKTYQLLKSCHTTTVFQLESRGMRDLIKRLQPDAFEEIVALVALFRPGPLQSGMVDDYIDRKHGRGKINCFHESLKPILEPTYGVILYQEQVMKIAQVLSNYSLGSADLLRRAMGKKKPEEMAKQRQIFIDGAAQNQISETKAAAIFDIIEKFAGYGFNKSHSAAYALVAYQTAYLKAHHPHAYLAAVLSSDMDHSDKVAVNIAECRRMRLKLLPPCINHSLYKFSVHENSIRYGLGAVKGVGESAIESLIEERIAHGPFTSLFDFCKRSSKQKVNRRAIEALIKSGAMDILETPRHTLFASIDKAMQYAEQQQHNLNTGQSDLFAAVSDDETVNEPPYEHATPWKPLTSLQHEKQVLGLYFNGHPMDHYAHEMKTIGIQTLEDITPDKKMATVAGIVASTRTLMTKRGDRMMVLILENAKRQMDVTLFSDLLEKKRDLIQSDQLLVVKGEVSTDALTHAPKIAAKDVIDLDQLRNQRVKRLHLKLKHQNAEAMQMIQHALQAHQANRCPVVFTVKTKDAQASFQCDDSWRIQPSDALLQALQTLDVIEDAAFEYQ